MKVSCGILPYRINEEKHLEIFLVHPGGPYFKGKEINSYSIPKGENEKFDKSYLDTAKREFFEECDIEIKNNNELIFLDSIQQRNNKIVYCWAYHCEENIIIKNNIIEIIYHGKKIQIPEIDKGQFFTLQEAQKKIIKKQFEFILRLYRFLKEDRKL